MQISTVVEWQLLNGLKIPKNGLLYLNGNTLCTQPAGGMSPPVRGSVFNTWTTL